MSNVALSTDFATFCWLLDSVGQSGHDCLTDIYGLFWLFNSGLVVSEGWERQDFSLHRFSLQFFGFSWENNSWVIYDFFEEQIINITFQRLVMRNDGEQQMKRKVVGKFVFLFALHRHWTKNSTIVAMHHSMLHSSRLVCWLLVGPFCHLHAWVWLHTAPPLWVISHRLWGGFVLFHYDDMLSGLVGWICPSMGWVDTYVATYGPTGDLEMRVIGVEVEGPWSSFWLELLLCDMGRRLFKVLLAAVQIWACEWGGRDEESFSVISKHSGYSLAVHFPWFLFTFLQISNFVDFNRLIFLPFYE